MAPRILLGMLAARFLVVGAVDYTQYVNIFRGTQNGGNMFPGVVPAPFSVVKLGPDLTESPPTDAYSGYLPGGDFFGFSMMHESGTGGAPKYGVVSQMPVAGAVANPLLPINASRAASDTASVGYYKAQLLAGATNSTNITVELAGTNHAGYYKYTFPQDAEDRSVVVDVSHVLLSYRGLGWSQNYGGGEFKIFEDGHYEGYGKYNGGWNLAPFWTIYFCGMFDTPASTGKTFMGNGTTLMSYGNESRVSGSERVGGVFTFKKTVVRSRVGISWISSQKACDFVNAEIPASKTLSKLVASSKSAWNDKLSTITTTTTDQSSLVQLYSNIYAMHIIPSNRTGENPAWDSGEPYYDDIFTFWDLFRCGTSLMQILSPTAYSEQIRSIIDIWKHEGWMPDARSSNWNGETQGGSNADNVIADAFVKNVQGVNWTEAYAAQKKDAEVTPPNNHDPRAPDSSTQQGRGALPDWLKYGYITPAFSRAGSRGVEYAANDFGLHQVALGLGLMDDAEYYLNRSRYWRNFYDESATSLNFTGFIQPRAANGSFIPYDPLDPYGYWMDAFYEASPWEYTYSGVHHDMAHMINITGGAEAFVKKLNEMFVVGLQPANGQFNNTIINPGNEPSFGTPYLFNFAGRQDLSVKHSRQIATSYYNAGLGGIPGNSDAGAMQTWQLWNMIGLYPLVGQTTFLIHAPWFEQLTIHLGRSKKLRITSSGGNLAQNIYYVQSLKVNGRSWNKSWVTWDDVFEHGGTMDFVLGPNVVDWATGELPPSPAS